MNEKKARSNDFRESVLGANRCDSTADNHSRALLLKATAIKQGRRLR